MSKDNIGSVNLKYYFLSDNRSLIVTIQVIVIAILYYVTGKFGNYLAIPPNYATIIWPPSGIALASILIFGYRVWPGIFLGAFLVNLSVILTKTSVDVTSSSLQLALVTGIGATIQALTGAHCVNRYADFPNQLVTEKQVFLFLVLGGVICCSINSTISTIFLLLLGQIAIDDFWVDWATWWLGDTIGVFIFTPLTFVWFSRQDFSQRRMLITVTYFLAFTVTLGIVFISTEREVQRLKSEFDKDANHLTFEIEKSVHGYSNALNLVSSFFAGSYKVERTEFKIFSEHLFKLFPGIQALEWAPIIKNQDRQIYENKIKAEGILDFSIKELDKQNNLKSASNRSEYAPVTFIEPYSVNAAILGFDQYSNSTRRVAIEKARDTGQMVATPSLQFIQEQTGQSGFIVFTPIYRNDSVHATLEDRRSNIVGYLLAKFRFKDFVTQSLTTNKPENLYYQLIDNTVPDNLQVLFSNQSSETDTLNQFQYGLFGRNYSYQQFKAIEFAGRQWQFQVLPTQNYLRTHHSFLPWSLFSSGLLITSIMGAIAMVASGRGYRLRKLVDEQTKALSNSEMWLQTIIEKNPECISLVNHVGDLVKVNIAGLAIFEANHSEQLIGLPLENFIAPEFCSAYHQTHQRVIGGETISMEFQIIGLKGRRCWLDSHSVPIQQSSGDTFHLAVARDISSRKQLEFSLATDRVRFQMLFELSPVGMALVDHQSGLFLDVNQSLLNSVGYEKDEFLALSFWQITPPEYNHQEAEQIESLDIRGRFGPNKKEYIRKDGSRFPISISGFLHTDNNGRKVVWGIIEDISERVRHELDLIESKEIAEALADSKSKFLASMSHEIRTPMNGIIGLTLLALNEPTSPLVRDYLHKISTSSHCLLDILNDILDFSKIEAGQMSINTAPFALDKLISNLSNLYEVSANSKQLAFKVDIADGVPRQLMGDSVRLQQILSNLIGNAIKFTTHGYIRLKISPKQFNETEVHLIFAVEDTGIGIAELDQTKLFRSFSQVDGAITRKFGGTGLGLAISQRLLNLMGSECQVDSKPGQGSIFSFELRLGMTPHPLNQQASHFKIPKPGSLEQDLKSALKTLKGARILLVEDNRINQMVVKKFLELSMLDVTLAVNGLEAVNLLKSLHFDAILMDVHMPVMDGLEATRQILGSGRHANLPIIALTAGVTSEEREACLDSGMCDFISKPVSSEIMVSKLLKWVRL